MPAKKNKLQYYSAAAATFLIFQEAQTQTIYTNIDPDIIMDESSDYLLDFNADGIIDIEIHAHYGSRYLTDYGYCSSSQNFSVNLDGMDALAINSASLIHPTPFNYGSEIGDEIFWNTENSIELIEIYRSAWSCLSDWADIDIFHPEWNDANRFLGVRFLADGNTYYGWVRFSVAQRDSDDYLSRLYIQDYGYNDTQDAPALIAVDNAPIVTNLTLKDLGEFNMPSDLKISFTHAMDESQIFAYRVFVFPADLTTPTIATLESLSAEYYLQILPTGADFYGSMPDAILDVNGNNLNVGDNYRVIVLSMADEIALFNNNNSIPSNNANFVLRKVHTVNEGSFYDVNNTGNISDFKINFHHADDESNISEYRVYISNYNIEYPYSELYDLSPDYYTSAIPTGALYFTVFPNTDNLIFDHGTPRLFETYYAYVTSWPDTVTSTYPNTSSWFNAVTFFYYPYNEIPQVYVNPGSDNSDQIFVASSKFHNEELLQSYRIYIIENGYELTPDTLANYGPEKYTTVIPEGIDFYTNLNSDQLVNSGLSVNSGFEYQIVIGYVPEKESEISFSYPSNAFTINEGTPIKNVISNPTIYNTNNILRIQFNQSVSYKIMLFSMMGSLVAEESGNGNSFNQNYENLPAGLYQVVIEMNDKRILAEIIISK